MLNSFCRAGIFFAIINCAVSIASELLPHLAFFNRFDIGKETLTTIIMVSILIFIFYIYIESTIFKNLYNKYILHPKNNNREIIYNKYLLMFFYNSGRFYKIIAWGLMTLGIPLVMVWVLKLGYGMEEYWTGLSAAAVGWLAYGGYRSWEAAARKYFPEFWEHGWSKPLD